jgi:hypothetical protein
MECQKINGYADERALVWVNRGGNQIKNAKSETSVRDFTVGKDGTGVCFDKTSETTGVIVED